MFETGDSVRTPEGSIGRIATPGSGSRFNYYHLSNDEMNIAVYTVILENGKVERWTGDALSEPVRRSGSLK